MFFDVYLLICGIATWRLKKYVIGKWPDANYSFLTYLAGSLATIVTLIILSTLLVFNYIYSPDNFEENLWVSLTMATLILPLSFIINLCVAIFTKPFE